MAQSKKLCRRLAPLPAMMRPSPLALLALVVVFRCASSQLPPPAPALAAGGAALSPAPAGAPSAQLVRDSNLGGPPAPPGEGGLAEQSQDRCGADLSGPVCLGGQVLLPPAQPAGLVGHWSFDGDEPNDLSGSGAHGSPVVPAGPAFAGQGSSALLTGAGALGGGLTIPGVQQLELRDFSYTFWLYLIDHHKAHAPLASTSPPHLCALLRKGSDVERAAPALLFDPASGRLRVTVATAPEANASLAADEIDGETPVVPEGFASHARLSRGRWYHIALVRLDGQKHTRLYINGILDATGASQGHVVPNSEPLHLGSGGAASGPHCNVPMYIDELKIYSRPVTPDELQAEAAPALAGIEPSFVRLACVDCDLRKAVESCPDEYHICDSLELHMGAYHVARSLGWLDRHTYVWSRSPGVNERLQHLGALTPVHAKANEAAAPEAAAASPPALVLLGQGRHSQLQAPSPAALPPGATEGEARLPPDGGHLGLGLCCADGAASSATF
eukprot:TRINITY_DN18035_c0_g1_i1.p1 TRINITY_DN18035_c0_g1~~TRINITY_DN18035_c0_g1_i1.p1  ORF type:complete len:524 (-),score=108.92 TRINITY_DN18035_c0_g1_i1:108-1613(-)